MLACTCQPMSAPMSAATIIRIFLHTPWCFTSAFMPLTPPFSFDSIGVHFAYYCELNNAQSDDNFNLIHCQLLKEWKFVSGSVSNDSFVWHRHHCIINLWPSDSYLACSCEY